MNDNPKCKCGKANMVYEPIGDDLWSGTPTNTTIKKDGYGKACYCKTCGHKYDTFDPCMVKIYK